MEPRRRIPSNTESVSEAADKAASRMRQLHSRLSEPGDTAMFPRETPVDVKASSSKNQDEGSIEDMERELQDMFARSSSQAGVLSGIRARVVEEIAEKILAQWELHALEDEVVERLIDKVMDRLEGRNLASLPGRGIGRR